MLVAILSTFAILIIADYLWKRRINKVLTNIPGPRNVPLLGATSLYLGHKPNELFELSNSVTTNYGRLVKFWIFHINLFIVSDASYIQTLLSHTTEIKKNDMYSLFSRWLGQGLLLSHGPKWLARRRAITPAFHFKILDSFISIFDQQAVICARKFNMHALEKTANLAEISGDSLDIEHYIGLATLDVICETAMGVKINAQSDENSEYVHNILKMQHIFLERFVKVAYRSDVVLKIFNRKLYARYQEVIKSLHEFTGNIIQERRKEMLTNQQQPGTDNRIEDCKESEKTTEAHVYGRKTRMALLDVLLSSTINGQAFSDDDIQEEVDTFMFEGHDTTKSGIGFTLYLLSRNQEVQNRLYEELNEVLGVDGNAPLTYNKLMDLKYMEKVIKESLRMYPPVPFIGRELIQDLYIEDQLIPKGCSIFMALMSMQNDPAYFTEPHKFLPDREAPQNAFVYVPFSAGPRNCIGQRFAMLEMKAFIARIIQSYELLPLGEEVKPSFSMVLKSETGWQMGFRKRY